MLTILNHLPDGLLESSPEGLGGISEGPVLIHLPGRRSPALFASVLVHGNEPTGFLAVCELLRRFRGKELPRELSIFIGNIPAARENARFLEGQPDYNRIWMDGNLPENRMALEVLGEIKRRGAFAAIDIHNTTGRNPHHSYINRLENRFLQLATLFGRTVVYSTRPPGTQSAAFADICPSVTVECGKPGHEYGVEHAMNFLDACLHLDHLPEGAVHEHDMELFHTVAIVRVPKNVSFGFGICGEDICFREDLDRLNFRMLPPGTAIASAKDCPRACLDVRDENGREVMDDYLALKNGDICIKQEVMPAMLTLSSDAIRQDCLCHFLERVNKGGGGPLRRA